MKKTVNLLMAVALMAAVLILTSCGGGGDDTIDNSHMFGTFTGTLVIQYENTQNTDSRTYEFYVGNDASARNAMGYIYIPTDDDQVTFSDRYADQGDEVILSYTASSTDNSITWERKTTENGNDVLVDEGTITFDNNFVTGEVRGSTTTGWAPSVKYFYQMTDMTKQ